MKVRSSDDENVDIMTVSDALDVIGAEDETTSTFEGETMSAKKKPAAEVETKAKAAKPSAKAAKPAGEAPAKEKGKFGPRQLPDGYVGVVKLAEDSQLSPAVVRRKLRGLEGIEKPADGWQWKSESKDYKAVLKAITAEAPAA